MKLKSHLENFQYSNDNNEFIKNEMTMMADQVKKAQDSYNNLLEIIKKKGNLSFQKNFIISFLDDDIRILQSNTSYNVNMTNMNSNYFEIKGNNHL